MDQFNCSDGISLPKTFFEDMNYVDFENLSDQISVWKFKKVRCVPVLVLIQG